METLEMMIPGIVMGLCLSYVLNTAYRILHGNAVKRTMGKVFLFLSVLTGVMGGGLWGTMFAATQFKGTFIKIGVPTLYTWFAIVGLTLLRLNIILYKERAHQRKIEGDTKK